MAASVIALSLVTGSGCLGAEAARWQRMTYADVYSPAGSSLRPVWGREMRQVDANFLADAGAASFRNMGNKGPFAAVSTSFSRASGTVLVSVMLGAGLCDSGANTASSTQIHSVCPMKVVVSGRGTAAPRTFDVASACFLDVAHDFDGVGPNPADNGDFAFLNQEGTELTVNTIREGKPIPGCSKVVSIQ